MAESKTQLTGWITIANQKRPYEWVQKEYSVSFIQKVARAEITLGEAALKGSSPSLVSLKKAFGFERASIIIQVLITNAVEYYGKGVLTEFQLSELADMIISEFYDLKLTEIALFVQKMKAGHLGKLYGNFSPAFVAECLQEYKRLRSLDIDRLLSKEREEKRKQEYEESLKNRATPEELQRGFDRFFEHNRRERMKMEDENSEKAKAYNEEVEEHNRKIDRVVAGVKLAMGAGDKF